MEANMLLDTGLRQQFPVDPAGIGIYWIASNVFALIQTVILSFTHSPKKMIAKAMVDETVERRSREENLKRALAQKKEEK